MKFQPVLNRCPVCKELFAPDRDEDIYCPENDPRLETPRDFDEIRREE